MMGINVTTFIKNFYLYPNVFLRSERQATDLEGTCNSYIQQRLISGL